MVPFRQNRSLPTAFPMLLGWRRGKQDQEPVVMADGHAHIVVADALGHFGPELIVRFPIRLQTPGAELQNHRDVKHSSTLPLRARRSITRIGLLIRPLDIT